LWEFFLLSIYTTKFEPILKEAERRVSRGKPTLWLGREGKGVGGK